MLQRAVASGRAPALAAVLERGTSTEACASFPSVTPVCAASIATGTRNDRHHIPSMNWFHRAEDRYVEYGSSFSAARRFGVVQQLTDTVFNMNAEHLPADCETVFESLDDVDVRTAGTTYLMYRGRHEHELVARHARSRAWPPRSCAGRSWARASSSTPTSSPAATPAAAASSACRACATSTRAASAPTSSSTTSSTSCCFSLPDNDTHSHKRGPHAQVAVDRRRPTASSSACSTPAAARSAFLDEHAVIVMADHSHAAVERGIDLLDAFDGLARPAAERRPARRRRARGLPGAARGDGLRARAPRRASDAACRGWSPRARALEGVDLVDVAPTPAARAVDRVGARPSCASPRRRRRATRAARRWIVDGDLGVLGARDRATACCARRDYPDALARAWAALTCPTSGDVLLSASPGYEFADWGGVDHVGGGSHGSLHRSDSLGALAFCGVGAEPDPATQGGGRSATSRRSSRRHFGLAGVMRGALAAALVAVAAAGARRRVARAAPAAARAPSTTLTSVAPPGIDTPVQGLRRRRGPRRPPARAWR